MIGGGSDAYLARRLFWDPTPKRNVADPALSLAHADLHAAEFGRRLDQLHVPGRIARYGFGHFSPRRAAS